MSRWSTIRGPRQADRLEAWRPTCEPLIWLPRAAYWIMADIAIWTAGHVSVAGVNEIRVHTKGEHRVMYVAKFNEAVYVLHAFEKKTQRTAQCDIELAKVRHRALVEERRRERS